MTTDPTPSQFVTVGKIATIIVHVDDDTATDLAAVLYAVDKRQLVKGCTTLRAWQGDIIEEMVGVRKRVDAAVEMLKGGDAQQ